MSSITNIKDQFEKLGIEYTRDLYEIKKAYYKRTFECCEADDREGWNECYDAYVYIKTHLENHDILSDPFREVSKNTFVGKDEILDDTFETMRDRYISQNKISIKKDKPEIVSTKYDESEKTFSNEISINETSINEISINKTFANKTSLSEQTTNALPLDKNADGNLEAKSNQGSTTFAGINNLADKWDDIENDEEVSVEDNPEKYRPMMKLLTKIIATDKLDDGDKYINESNFNILHSHTLYNDAMTYPVFINRLIGIFEVCYHSETLTAVLEDDISKAKSRIKPGQTIPNYDRFLSVIRENELDEYGYKKTVRVTAVATKEDDEADLMIKRIRNKNKPGKALIIIGVYFIIRLILGFL